MALAWAFQPLYPEERAAGPLLEQAAALIEESHRLGATAGTVAPAVAPLLRAMLSYYTNRIEGQHTRPADIERALARQYDADQKQARKQRLAVAHMGAEVALEAAVITLSRPAIYDAGLVARIHRELYSSLPESDRVTDEGAVIVPGACSHHRLLWIHPFVDGNGRVARLHTHLVVTALDLTHGLWSPLRGIARDVESYYARLNNADLPRRNDLDGRGPLSQEELVAFSGWLLDVCLDQVRFMRGLLALDALKARIADLLGWLRQYVADGQRDVHRESGRGRGAALCGHRGADRARAFHGPDRPVAAHRPAVAFEPARLRRARCRDFAGSREVRGPTEEPSLALSAPVAGGRGRPRSATVPLTVTLDSPKAHRTRSERAARAPGIRRRRSGAARACAPRRASTGDAPSTTARGGGRPAAPAPHCRPAY